MEGLLENVRQLSRELRLQMLLIDSFIPPEYQVVMSMYKYVCMCDIVQATAAISHVGRKLRPHAGD